MIDFLVNEFKGISIVHDEKTLDNCNCININKNNGEVYLEFLNGDIRNIGQLKDSMLQFISENKTWDHSKAYFIRMSGLKIAKVHLSNVNLASAS